MPDFDRLKIKLEKNLEINFDIGEDDITKENKKPVVGWTFIEK